MARRQGKQDEELLKALLGLIVLGTLFFTFYVTGSLVVSGVATGFSVVVFFVVVIIVHIKNIEKLKRSGIKEIDRMDGLEFEKYLALLFRSLGYKVHLTPGSSDYGADLIMKKDGRKITVQAKRYQKNVGKKAVQEAHASMPYYKAQESWVVTNSYYTDQAKILAKTNKVKLIDRDQLVQMIIEANEKKKRKHKQTVKKKSTIEEKKVICSKCKSEMELRTSQVYGLVYICTKYPICNSFMKVKKKKPLRN